MQKNLPRGGTLLGLSILLAHSNGRGGGDLGANDPLIGSWANDRIVIAGDYGDKKLHVPKRHLLEYNQNHQDQNPNLYHIAAELYENISHKVILVLCQDTYLKQELQKSFKEASWQHEEYKKEFPELYKVLSGEM